MDEITKIIITPNHKPAEITNTPRKAFSPIRPIVCGFKVHVVQTNRSWGVDTRNRITNIMLHQNEPFHVLPGSTESALSTIVSVDNPQNAGSSWVRNCSASLK